MLSVYWQYKKWACTWWYMHEGIQLSLSKKLGQCPFFAKETKFWTVWKQNEREVKIIFKN